VVDLEFRGWARLDAGAMIAWDLLFYEPWRVTRAVPPQRAATPAAAATSGYQACSVPQCGQSTEVVTCALNA
jgi:hypothetical protein